MKTFVHTIIFTGKVEPSLDYVGTISRPRAKKDKFGLIPPGNERRARIDTDWGQLQSIPNKFIGKKITIAIEHEDLDK
ncbi:MAG: hypothetical protein ACREBJ_08175 [Nitrosotalea sp.]